MIGFVICHKSLAHELIETAQAILGHNNDLYPFSNDKITNEELLLKLEKVHKKAGKPTDLVIMVDLRGGNCWHVAKLFARSHPGYFVLSGVNLPMIFSFLTKKETLDSSKLIKTMETDSHRGIIVDV